MKKFKFSTFMKIFGISFGSLIGVMGITLGVMKLVGALDEPAVYPNQIVIEGVDHNTTNGAINVDGNFKAKITATTDAESGEITKKDIVLSFVTTENIKENAENGTITDNVITIPKYVKIGEEFEVIVNKIPNDKECGQDWIAGGHSEIRATSKDNPNNINSAKLKVNVDVPVYKIELITSSTENMADENNEFVVNSQIYTGLKFIPARSQYQFSQDGENGTNVVNKNVYFKVKNKNDDTIEQQSVKDVFNAKITGTSTIVGYCYKSPIIEENRIKDKDYISIVDDLDLEDNYTGENIISFRSEKSIKVVSAKVDSLAVSGKINDTKKGIEYTIYANKSNITDSYASNLGIKLSSSLSTASLQTNLNYVGIRFYIIQNETEIDCVNSEENSFIEMKDEYYSQTITKDGKIYYLPILTQSIANYQWKFAVKDLYKGEIRVEVAYLEQGSNEVDSKVVSFRTEDPISSTISWNTETKDVTLKILDNEEGINYQTFDLTNYVKVPSENQYKTVKYFAYFDNDTGITDYTTLIVCSSAKEYTINSQRLKLYEIENGILQAKSTYAHDLTVHCIYATVETYLGNPKIVDDKYVIDQFSYNTRNDSIDTVNVKLEKTVQSFDSYMDLVISQDDLITEQTADNKTKFAFVQGYSDKNNSFDLCIKNKVENEIEKEIFKKALKNGEISLVAFIDGAEQDASGSLLTFIKQTIVEEDNYIIQRYKVYIGKLSDNDGDPKITFAIRYYRLTDSYKDYKVEYTITKVNGQDTTPITADFIEIYSGKATVFAFNYNYDEDSGKIIAKTSKDNPIIETSTIEENNGIINSVTTSYKFNGSVISDLSNIFEVDANGNPTILKIKMADKYGRTPIYSDYYLEESSNDNPKILTFADAHHYSFVTTGSATLLLKSKQDNSTLDTLYLKREGSGEISSIKIINQNSDYNFEQKELIDANTTVSEILEKTTTIDVVGARGTSLDFTSTSEGAINFVEYTYSYENTDKASKNASLKQLTKFKIVDGWVDEYFDYIDIIGENGNKLTDIANEPIQKITFTRNFGGQNVRLKFYISVPELGISQYVMLNIKPNIQFSITQDTEDLPDITDENNTSHFGYYSEKYYAFNIVVKYNKNDSTYADNYATYFVFKLDNNPITQSTTFAKLKTDFEIDSSNQNKITIKAYISFSAFEEQNKCMKLTFTTNDTKSNDPETVLPIYVKQNIKATLNSSVLYLSTQNISTTVTTTGTVELSKYITFERLKTTDLGIDTGKITYELDAQSKVNGYEIIGSTLKCNKQLTQVEDIKIIVKYNGCEIATLTVKISPNIRENNENSDWLTYNDERYVKLVGGKTYNQSDLKQMLYSDNNEITNIDSITISNSEYINEINKTYEIKTLQKITTDNIKLTATLNNGNYLIFNVILLPQDLPYVAYEMGDSDSFDLFKSFSEDYLAQNDYYTTVKSGSSININDLKGDKSNFGILLQNSTNTKVEYRTNNSDFVSINDDGTLTILPTARNNEYVFVYAYVWFNNSVTYQAIPYRLLIEKELNLKIYYPYQDGESSLIKQNEQTLISPSASFDREYITVESNGKAEVPLLESQSIYVPNKSAKESKRIALFKQSEEYEGRYTVKFEVTRVFYTSIKGDTVQFEKAGDITSFASIINNKLMLNTKNMPKVRVEIKVSTLGAEGYYYVSAGETPNFELYNSTSETITEIDITAGESINLTYKLNKQTIDDTTKQVIATEDKSDLLKMFTTNYSLSGQKLTIEKINGVWTLSADDCPSDWTAVLVAYTIYGEVKQIKVNIKSNYEVVPIDYNSLSNNVITFDNITITKDNFTATKNEDNVKKSITIQNMTVLSQITTDIQKYVSFTQNSITIGAVDKEITFTFELEFNLGTDANGKDLIYTRSYKYVVKPSLNINSIDSQPISETNKLEIQSENIAKNNDGTCVVTVDLYSDTQDSSTNSLFVKTDSSNDIKIGKFNVSLISEVALKEKYKFDATISGEQTQFTITCPRVAYETIVSFKIEYYNEFDGQKYVVYTGYIVLTLKENFEIITNYPQQSENATKNLIEYFFIGESSDEPLKLNTNSTLGTNQRVKIKENGSDVSTYDNYYVTATATSKTTKINGGTGDYKSFTTSFTFTLVEKQDDVTLTIYIKIEDNYFAVGEYLVKICKDITDVWSIKTYNFNQSGENSSVNPEQIFIGSSDNVTSTVKVDINMISNLDTSKKYYFEIISLFETTVTQSERILAVNGSTTVTLYLSATNALVEQKFNQDIVSGFYLYEGDSQVTDEEVLKLFKFQVTGVNTRIKLYYNSIECGIDKLYTVTNLNSLSYDEEKNNYEIAIASGNRILGYYFSKQLIDVEFTQYTFDVQTGDKVNLVYGNGYELTAGLKRRSDGTYYSASDLKDGSDSSKQFTIEQIGDIEYTGEDTKTKNYMLISQTEYSSRIIDYIMLAMGAPNTSVTASVKFKITINDNSEEFTLVFTISNDYGSSLSTLNGDGSQNSESNPFVVTATSDNRLYNSLTFATCGNEVVDNEYIFIQHTGTVSEGLTGNLAPLFGITLDSSYDTQHIYKSESTDSLIFQFDKVKFGNKTYHLIFSDEYGYTFEYYIMLNATYDASYKQGTIQAFENKEVIVTSTTKVETGSSVKIPITFTNDIDIDKIEILNLSFVYTDSNNNAQTKIISTITGRKFTTPYLSDLQEKAQVSGRLEIELMYDDDKTETITFKINFVIKPQYTIKTLDEDVYVRDGVAFDVLDVVEVVSNENPTVIVGERYLEKTESAKIKLTTNFDSIKAQLGDNADEYIIASIGLSAKNSATGKLISEQSLKEIPLTGTNTIYSNLYDTFEITSTENLTFELLLYDTSGNKHYIVDSKGETLTLQTLGLYNSEGKITEDISIDFYKYTYIAGDKEYSIYLSEYSNSNGSSTIEVDGHTYTKEDKAIGQLVISKDSQIIKDQVLKIGVSDIRKYGQNTVSVYFSNNEVLNVECNTVENKVISLMENGIITSGNYTELATMVTDKTYINNGLSQESLKMLKDFDITEVTDGNSSKLSEKDGGYTLNLKNPNGNTSLEWNTTTIDGITFVYQKQTLNISLQYSRNEEDSKYGKNGAISVDCKVTLKYVSVDKRQAYGTNTLKYVSLSSQHENNTTITLEKWAGTSSDTNAFKLDKGFTNAVSYAKESLYFAYNTTTSPKLTFAISESSDSASGGKFATIQESGTITLFKDFDISKYYLPIDVYLSNNVDEKHLIATVQLAFRVPVIDDIVQNNSTLIVENGKAKKQDVWKLFNIKDTNNNTWTSDNFETYFNNSSIYILNGDTKMGVFASSEFSIDKSKSIQIAYGTSSTGYKTTLTGYKTIDYRYTANCLQYITDVTSFNFGVDFDLYFNDTGKECYRMPNITQTIVNKVGEYLAFKNSIGNLDYLSKLYFLQDEEANTSQILDTLAFTSGDYTCTAVRGGLDTGPYAGYYDYYTLTYTYGTITLGSVQVNFWHTTKDAFCDVVNTASSKNFSIKIGIPSKYCILTKITQDKDSVFVNSYDYTDGTLNITFSDNVTNGDVVKFKLTYVVMLTDEQKQLTTSIPIIYVEYCST